MRLYHDSRSLDCRAPLGALKNGAAVRLRIYTEGDVRSVALRLWEGKETLIPMIADGCGAFVARFFVPDAPTLLWYYFIAEDQAGGLLYLGNASDGRGGAGEISQSPPSSFQITVYDPAFSPPSYLREGLMYQIFPDRFNRSALPAAREGDTVHETWDELPLIDPDPESGDNRARDFFGGNLRGIAQKLNDLKALGVTVLYLNPIFSARSNHRYDTADYERIDSYLGDDADFAFLCGEAEKRGMRILLDGVFSHTGDDSAYFNRRGRFPQIGAYQSEESPYFSWYTFERFPDKYRCWWGVPTLPELNKQDPACRDFLISVARLWLKKGASGWRLDVADELPMPFLRELRSSVKAEKPSAALIGEVWEDASNKVSYGQTRCYCLGDTADSVMNYPLREGVIDFLTRRITASELARRVESLRENYPKPFFYSLMNLTGSHDRARILNVLTEREYMDLPWKERGAQRLSPSEYRLAVARYRKLLQIYAALPGIPSIYYGDECGMQGAADPFCRGTYPKDGGDDDIRRFVKECFKARADKPVLRTGDLRIFAEGDDTLVIERFAHAGYDVFGQYIGDDAFTLRVCRNDE